ncbi:MAG TPA: helix-turn-helix domain-containing protein [Nocardioides sp.]|nr:helix-turn-helix domain-containing protein [Nocardioides sp.]
MAGETSVQDLQRMLDYQRSLTRSAVRNGLRGAVSVLSRELRRDAVVLDEYGVVMASSTRRREVLDAVAGEYQRQSGSRRAGAVAVDTAEGTLELQMIQGRSGVCGWLAVVHPAPPTHTERLQLNQAAALITLQLDWPTELVAAYRALGGTLLALLLDTGGRATGLERHLHHFGFEANDRVVVAVAACRRRVSRVEEEIAAHLEVSKQPHVVTRVDSGVAILLLERDAEAAVAGIASALSTAGIEDVALGLSGRLEQDAIATGLGPAELAAQAARRDGTPVGAFADLRLGPVLADDVVRERVWALAAPALDALESSTGARDADLLATLDAFLQHNGSWEAASKEVGIHRHTLRSRIARVEELTGLGLDVAENRALLLLALLSRPLRTGG